MAPDIKVKNIKEKYFNSQTGACEWSSGSEHGEESLHCSPAMAHQVCHHLDGQHGSIVLDSQSWEGMESVCS